MKKYQFFISFFLLFCQSSAYAGFADDWLANSTTTSPSYFEGQKRGYLSAGGYSARWKTSNDYLVSVTTPRISAGCGGIDAFWGGMSFLDAEYLVDKLEKVLENAPAVALDLAMNVLCEPCSNAMKWMEDKANMLNSLQLDDCKASKAVVAKTFQSLGSDSEELNDIVTDFEVSSGISKFYTSSRDSSSSNGGKPSGSSVKDAVADCDSEIRSIFISEAETNGKSSILTNIAKRLGMKTEYAQFLAGIIGDIGIDWTEDTGFTTYDIPFCEQNKALTDASNLFDKPYLRNFNDPNGQCTQASDANGNIKQYVNDKLTSIASKMQSRSALSSEESNFLNYCSGVTYNSLKLAVEMDNLDAVLDLITDLTAKDITRNMLNDLYSKGESMLAKAEEIAKKQETTTSDDTSRCQIEMFEGAFDKMKSMRTRISETKIALNNGYRQELEQMNAFTTFIREHYAAAKRFEAEVGKRFGYQMLSK